MTFRSHQNWRWSVPVVVVPAVDDTGAYETGRLRIENGAADGAAQTRRVPRSSGHLNQETVGDELSAGSTDTSSSSSYSNSSSSADYSVDYSADYSADHSAAIRIAAIWRRRRLRLQNQSDRCIDYSCVRSPQDNYRHNLSLTRSILTM